MKSKYKTVVIDVPMDDESVEQLMCLKDSPILDNANQIFLLTVYNDMMGHELPAWIVNKNDFPNIEKYVHDRLEDIMQELCPNEDQQRKWATRCLFNGDPKQATLDFLEEVKADLTISATRGEQNLFGVFKKSFSSHLIETAPCDVYVVRPVH